MQNHNLKSYHSQTLHHNLRPHHRLLLRLDLLPSLGLHPSLGLQPSLQLYFLMPVTYQNLEHKTQTGLVTSSVSMQSWYVTLASF